jgi:hypothetical protein
MSYQFGFRPKLGLCGRREYSSPSIDACQSFIDRLGGGLFRESFLDVDFGNVYGVGMGALMNDVFGVQLGALALGTRLGV